MFFTVLSISLVRAPDPSEVDFVANGPTRDEIISHYFALGYTAVYIHYFLTHRHGIFLSLRHVRRLQWRLGLYSSRRSSNIHDVVAALREELAGSGRLLGYRLMWRRLNNVHGLRVSQNVTRLLLGIMDPVGVELRKRRRLNRRQYRCKGPNQVWHIDGMDKLKQFGFAVHACIDGYSRKILWLKVGRSNNNPAVIGGFYLATVKQHSCVPRIVRSDRGTENCLVRSLQISLRMTHNDSMSGFCSFRYGKSTTNQRIESFWCQLRRMVTQFWMNFFKDMRDSGAFDNSNPIHIECIRFCFTHILQADLNRAVGIWNNHTIRKQRTGLAECPTGKPNMMYHFPEYFDAIDQSKPILFSEEEINEVEVQYCTKYPQYGCSDDFADVVRMMVGEDLENIDMPTTAVQALTLYTNLIEVIEMYDEN